MKSWPNRRLVDLLKTDHPIILSPMSRFGTVELAAAVCSAGGLGSIGCALLSPDEAAREAASLRKLTDRPFSLNFFCHKPSAADEKSEADWLAMIRPYYEEHGLAYDPDTPRLPVEPFGEAMCQLVEDVRPTVTSFHAGLPSADFVSRIKAVGSLIMSSATSVEEAVWLESHGADIVIAQGIEAGGHRGSFLADDLRRSVIHQLGTFTLVPQVVDAVKVPVVAAGGVGDARGIVGAFALGASGVQMGTAYLLCPETIISPVYRKALRARPPARTVLTNVFTGRPGRAFGNRLTADLGPISDRAPAFPNAMYATTQLVMETARHGSSDFMACWAGQASPLGRELPGRVLTELFAHEALARFGYESA